MAFSPSKQIRTPAKIGSAMFFLWSILHVYVGVTGALNFYTADIKTQWATLLGGTNAPLNSFVYPTDSLTINAQSHLILNFCLDVGGFGVLGLFVAWMIWRQASWTGFWIGVIAIGIADLSFLFALVISGVIVADLATIAGPVIWFIAVGLTPLGLPRKSKTKN